MEKLNSFLKVLGPGLIAGASDDDPTAIATYSQSGAQFGYHQLWTTLFTIPFMIVIQEMCGRIGIVSGKGIAYIVKTHYSKYFLYASLVLLIAANTINLGADVGAIAQTVELLWHIPLIIYLVTITTIILSLQIFIGYKPFATILKYASIVLLTYVVTGFITKQNWVEIVKSTIIPYFIFKKAFILNLVAIFGTNVSPYLFFWQANEEIEEEVEKGKLKDEDSGKPKRPWRDIKLMRIDTTIGMIFSNIILFFIEITAASTLGAHGITNVDTPTQAALALNPLAGNASFFLFTFGIIASGFLAVPVLSTSCAYAISETFNWKAGLNKNFNEVPRFFILIIAITILGLCINFLPIKPFDLLVYAAALNGVLTPFLIVLILLITNNKKIMGKYKTPLISNVLGVLLAVTMLICAGFLVFSLGKK